MKGRTPLAASRACLAALLAGCLSAQTVQPAAPELLEPGRPTEVYVAPGRATTIQLMTDRKVSAISIASPIVAYRYDKALNQLELTPAVRTPGVETNLNLRIGACVYVLLARVVNDVRVQYWRSFTLADGPEQDDEAALARARPLAPADVDVVGAAEALVRSESDPVFRDAQPNLRVERLGRSVPWNGCEVELVDLAQFLDRDLIVFRVRWVNRTPAPLAIDLPSYGLAIGPRPIPVIARTKLGLGENVGPGQVETVFLAVQGYRLSRHNDWRLVLPPDAGAEGPPGRSR